MKISRTKKIELLRDYFEKEEQVVLAFLFGSQAGNQARNGSDWDIGVYLKSQENKIEWENRDVDYPEESRILGDLIDILKTDNVDLVVLNRAPSHLAASIITGGLPLAIKDRSLFLEFMLIVTQEGEDYRNFIHDYYRIYQHALSLTGEERTNLEKRVVFLENELKDFEYFEKFTFATYEDRFKRKEIERWIEYIMNAVIDISKIIVASEKKPIPETYKDAVLSVGFLKPFSEETMRNLARFTTLRNILAHEYLDIRWSKISDFLKNGKPYSEKFLAQVKKLL